MSQTDEAMRGVPPKDEAEETAPQKKSAGFDDAARGFLAGLLHPAAGIGALIALLLGAFFFQPGFDGPNMCAFQSSTGLPCPGCGLTRSVTCLMHGELGGAWQYNPFGYVFSIFFLLMAGALLVPRRLKTRFLEKSRAPLYVFSLVILLITLMLVHGIARALLVKADLSYYQFWNSGGLPPALEESHELTPMHFQLFHSEAEQDQSNEKTEHEHSGDD